MKKLPIALALFAAAGFALAACDSDDEDTVPVSPVTVVPTSVSPSPYASASVKVVPSASKSVKVVPSASVSVSVLPSDTNKNDVPGDGGR